MSEMFPVFSAAAACQLAGGLKPDTLRSWHVRSGLALGRAEMEGAHRRYSLADCATLRFVKDATEFGLPVAALLNALDPVKKAFENLAEMTLEDLRAAVSFALLMPSMDHGYTVRVVLGRHGEAGVAALQNAVGVPVLIYGLSDAMIRTKNEREEMGRSGHSRAAGEAD